MTSTTFFIIFIPILAILLLFINLLLAPHNPYQEKDSAFECGFHSFLGQNRTQFSISFFIFALLFLLFDLEIVLIYPYSVSSYSNDIYGLVIMMVFFVLLTLGFVFELGKNALTIDSKQIFIFKNKDKSNTNSYAGLNSSILNLKSFCCGLKGWLLFSLIYMVVCTINSSFISCDAPTTWELHNQDSASSQMEAFVELHDNIVYYLVSILLAVGWIQGAIIRNFQSSRSPISNKYLNHGTLIELIWTITSALILVLIAFPSFKLLYLMDEVTDPSLSVVAEGHQWYWSYEYPDFLTSDKDFIELDNYQVPDYNSVLSCVKSIILDNTIQCSSSGNNQWEQAIAPNDTTSASSSKILVERGNEPPELTDIFDKVDLANMNLHDALDEQTKLIQDMLGRITMQARFNGLDWDKLITPNVKEIWEKNYEHLDPVVDDDICDTDLWMVYRSFLSSIIEDKKSALAIMKKNVTDSNLNYENKKSIIDEIKKTKSTLNTHNEKNTEAISKIIPLCKELGKYQPK